MVIKFYCLPLNHLDEKLTRSQFYESPVLCSMSLQYIGLVDFYPTKDSNHKTVKLNSMHVQFCSIRYAKLCMQLCTCTVNTLNDITIATLVKCLIIKETL